MQGDQSSGTPDLTHERRVIAVVAAVVVAVLLLGLVLTHLDTTPGPVPVQPTAYARISETRLAVQFDSPQGQHLVSVTAEETRTAVIVRVLVTPYDPTGGRGIAPIDPVTTTVDLAAPLGDRKVVDETGEVVPEQSRDDLGV